MSGVDFNGGIVYNFNIGTQLIKNSNYSINIGNGRYVFNAANSFVAQKYGRNYSNCGIFGAADLNGAVEGTATANLIFIQAKHLPYKGYQ